jgi:hypothetical protein
MITQKAAFDAWWEGELSYLTNELKGLIEKAFEAGFEAGYEQAQNENEEREP